MSLNADTSTALVTAFQGSSQSQDSYDVDPAHGLYSQNNDFILGQASSVQAATRRGTSQLAQIPSGDGSITTIYSWFYSYQGTQLCLVAMYSPVKGVRFYSINAGAFTEIVIPVTGAASAVFVSDNLRLYAAFSDFSGRKGISQGYVFGLDLGTVVTSDEAVDTLFSSPLTTSTATVTVSQTTSGVITAGTHRIGYVFLTRNGNAAFALNPVTVAGVFAPVSFTAADGVHNISVAIHFASIPAYLNPTFAPVVPTVQLVMTSAANPAEYYLIPGAIGNVPSTPGTVTITASITDGDLVTGTNVTINQTVLTAIAGSGPFNPWSIFTYSSRMGYCTLDASGTPVTYFSDVGSFQSIFAATSGVYLEGNQIPVTGCSLGGICYIGTIAGLYTTQDNGGTPTTWVSPSRVDGSVGILAPTCMLAVGGKMLLASEKGLYLYRGGPFPNIPISYFNAPDWQRINWAQPTQVQVVDDATDKVIRVMAPLSVVVTGASNTNPITITTAVTINSQPVTNPHLFQTGLSVTIAGVGGNTAANTTAVITVTGPNTFTIPVAGNGAYTSGGVATPNSANAIMCWNYVAGDSPGTPFFSLHAFGAYRAGAMGIVRNTNTQYDECWFASSSTGPGGLIRRTLPTDSLPYRDQDMAGAAAAIVSTYETSLLPGSQDEAILIRDFSGCHVRMTGNGSVNVAAYTLDHAFSLIPLASPITLSGKPGLEYLIRWNMRNEAETISLGTSLIDAYVVISIIRAYYVNSLPVR